MLTAPTDLLTPDVVTSLLRDLSQWGVVHVRFERYAIQLREAALAIGIATRCIVGPGCFTVQEVQA